MENHKEMKSKGNLRVYFSIILLGMTCIIHATGICRLNFNQGIVSDRIKVDYTAVIQTRNNIPPQDSVLKLGLLPDNPQHPDPTNPMEPMDPFDPMNPLDPLNPDEPTTPESFNSNYSVGNPTGDFTVSNSGAAIYNLKIEAPNGGPLTPQISLSYNSQSNGYGLAGYGFNITGISVITRGGHDLFHDLKLGGLTYTASDNLFLDGKRLVLQSGISGQEGAIYTVEGDPFTKIIIHGNYDNNMASTWFEVRTKDGMIYQYGNSPNSKISYRNKSGLTRIASWYINKVEDKYTNYMTYDYAISNLSIRPVTIIYGTNATKSRGIINKISFAYQNLGDNSRVFAIEDQQGKIDVCLSSVTTSCNNFIYRKYSFIYEGNNAPGKWSRLVKIEESNGHGEVLPPVWLNWQYMPYCSIYSSMLDVETKDNRSYIEEISRHFFSADLTGDGISDIVKIAPVKITSWGDGQQQFRTYLYISRSKMTSSGNVTYESPLIYHLPVSISMGDIKSILGGSSVIDFDGDGYNDLFIPFHNQVAGHWNQVNLYMILGSDIVAGKAGNPYYITRSLISTDKVPLLVAFDIDGNGKDEVIYVEQRKKDNYYPCTIIKHTNGMAYNLENIQLTLPQDINKNIEKIFTGDYNHDGLSDMILLYKSGYKIYYNNGDSINSVKFTEDNTKSGTDFGNYRKVQQGDFNGDGLIDFIYNKTGESCLWIAYNNGDGTFTNIQSEDLGIYPSPKDENRFSIMVWDMNHDGRSDVMVCIAAYKPLGFYSTQIRWLYSTGTTLKLAHSYNKNREDDALESNIFFGDFDGDGNIELANYGSTLNSDHDYFAEKINIYKTGYNLSQNGKITSIKDGMGNMIHIQYAYTTNPLVYKQTLPKKYPVNTYTLPISVVEKVISDNGSVGSQTTKYSYEDMRLHIAGRGMLGFNTVVKENITVGTKEVTNITKWDEKLWIPIETRVTSSIGNSSSVAVSTSTVSNVGKNYFAYVSKRDITDFDGNKTTTITHYDISKGVVTEEIIKNDGDNMYKKVSYSGYQNKAGVWLPSRVTMSQKHKDDFAPFRTTTTYKYDEKGNILVSVVNAPSISSSSPLALTTVSTYDVYGNILSSVSMGDGVKNITKYNDYDASGRFVIRNYTNPSSAVNTFTYDLWGNMLTESDATEPSNILTTEYSYDGWGRKESSLTADGTLTIYERRWGSNSKKKYYVEVSAIGKPTVITWYDKGGKEIFQETTGVKGIAITKTTSYNNKGQIARIENKTGKQVTTQTFAYDERGRVTTDALSTGQTTSYTYGNRSVTSTVSGRSYTRIIDAWGNLVKATDPAGEVEYAYSSIGKPRSVKVHGSTVTMAYDAAGNQVSLTDPNAGTSNYTYAADGTLLTQTDGRGIKTINTYDDLGRLSSTQIGQKNINYFYGTSGYEKLRLVKLTMDNNSVNYTYDKFGRKLTEKRNISGKGTYNFSYEYDNRNLLAKTGYPGGIEVTYQYDENGFITQTSVGDNIIYKMENHDGFVSSTSFMGKLTTTQTRDTRGYESNIKIMRGTTVLENFDINYDGATANLLSRRRNGNPQETFVYDNLDRLVSVKTGTTETMKINYAPNGNILFKTDLGNYSYDDTNHPHAVTEADDANGKISSHALKTYFNDFGKIQLIADEGKNQRVDFIYGPGLERWYSELTHDGIKLRTTIYAGQYEKVTEKGTTREFYYLDGNTIVIKENGTVKIYLAFTDNLGSFLSVMDENGTKVFDASYDAWGKQIVTLNTIGLHRGYTGHEMLNDFDIINMNGRLYDPFLARFFSPDNYVQMPDNSQNFNRYSYCLNNPLKYTDPSGELAWFIPVIAGAVIGAYTGASIQSGTAAFWNWKSDAWKGAIAGGIIGATIGYGVSSALTTAPSSTITGMFEILNEKRVITQAAGITNSVLQNGTVNIAMNTVLNGGFDGAWKAGVVGLATGAWGITGGFGMVKGFGTTSNLGKLAGKIGYQLIGTTSQSIGDNWAAGKNLLSKVTLGIGPINLTLGKGQKLLQWQSNLGNIITNMAGITNLAFGGKIRFNWDNLSPVYYGGMRDRIFQEGSGYGVYSIFGSKNLFDPEDITFNHELHHLWHSRAMSHSFLLNYGLQGITAGIMGDSFIKYLNYYEHIAYAYKWFTQDY